MTDGKMKKKKEIKKPVKIALGVIAFISVAAGGYYFGKREEKKLLKIQEETIKELTEKYRRVVYHLGKLTEQKRSGI